MGQDMAGFDLCPELPGGLVGAPVVAGVRRAVLLIPAVHAGFADVAKAGVALRVRSCAMRLHRGDVFSVEAWGRADPQLAFLVSGVHSRNGRTCVRSHDLVLLRISTVSTGSRL